MTSVNSGLYSSSLASIYALSRSTDAISTATERLATHSRLNRAGDDVGGLAIATGLQTNIATLRGALNNATQADSLLQTAYGGLNTINDILTDLLATATQATSGALSPAARAALQVHSDGLVAQIDQIAGNTEFNGIKLLDGSVSGQNAVTTTTTAATAANATLTFTANPAAGQTVIINGVTLTANTQFAVAGSTNLTLTNLSNAINNSTNTSLNGISASVAFNTLTLTSKAGGQLGNRLLVNQAGSTTTFLTGGGTTFVANLFQFQGGAQNGLFENGTQSYGTIGDTLVDTQTQSRGSVRLSATANYANTETVSIDNGNGGLLAFTFRTVPVAQTDVAIGVDTQSSVQNLIEKIQNYSGNEQYVINQLDFIRDGTDLVIRSKNAGNPTDLVFTALNFAEGAANATLSSGTLNNGVTSGVTVSGVTNKDFIGTVSGFAATYNSADNVTANVTVGNYNYQATITDTTPAANTTVRFSSTTAGGGFFDLELNSVGGGMSVGNQANADTYAARLNQAFASLNFSQNRTANSFTGTGNLASASFEFELKDFSNVSIDDLKVTAPSSPGGNANIQFTVNGEIFQSPVNLGSSIGARETIEFQSTSTTNKITLRNGSQDNDLSTQALADSFKTLLQTDFNMNNGHGAISFQVGDSTTNTIDVSINSAKSNKIFNGQTLDLSTIASSGTAETIIQAAIDVVAGLSAQVGTYQERAGFASDDLNAQIATKEQARSDIADTDIPTEATNLALATVRAQSAIAVLAQTNSLQSYMLHLLTPSG